MRPSIPNALRVDLLDPATLRQLSAQPERLRELVDANSQKKHIVIDEIQKLPELLEVVHQLVERKSGQQFILTGSSARKLRRQVSRKTVEGYLEILEDLLLGFRIEVFTRRAKRVVASHPKFFFFDAGVFRESRPTGPLDSPAELDGAALEGLVGQHLRAWCDYSDGRHRLQYWQTRSRAEVDFIVYGKSGIHAVEVKNSRKVDFEALRALKSFGEDYPQSRRYFLYRGKDRLQRDGVLCMPCEEFLLNLRPNHFPT